MHAAPIEALIESFEQLPGIGRKSAERIAFYVLDFHVVGTSKKNVCKYC